MRSASSRGIPDGTGDDGRRSDHGGGPHHRTGARIDTAPIRFRRTPCPVRLRLPRPEEWVALISCNSYCIINSSSEETVTNHVPISDASAIPVFYQEDGDQDQRQRGERKEPRHFNSEFGGRINFPS